MFHRIATRFTVALVLLCGAGLARAQLTYVERSTGLNNPTLDTGNTELEFGDVNGDGHPDLASVGDHGSPNLGTNEHGVTVWFGDGAGNWSVFQYGNFGYGGIALGDVNNDGLMDVGYGIHHNYSSNDLGNQILEVALGDGTGHYWVAWDDGLASNGETYGMFGSDFADVNNDGHLDLGSISFGCCNGVHIYRNNTNGTWTQTFSTTGGNSTMLIQFGDVNGDGYVDFACGDNTGTVYLGNGAGGFALADGNLPGGNGRAGTALGDVNDDGRDDLAFATATGIGVYKWVAPGQWQNLSGTLANVGAVQLTQIADMNLDGHGDIVAFFLGHVTVYAGNGQGQWQAVATVVSPTACDFAAFRAGTDFDHNGYPDFAFIAEENCQPWVGGTNHLHAFAEASLPTTPWIYPKYPRGGEKLIAGSVRFVDWHAAVPAGSGQPTMSIELSIHGSGGPFGAIVDQVPNNGRFQWIVPPHVPPSANCYLRFTLDTEPPATATTPNTFTILNPAPPPTGDVNCDGTVDFGDINPFVQALADPSGYAATYPLCDVLQADCNDDGVVDFADINPFIALLSG